MEAYGTHPCSVGRSAGRSYILVEDPTNGGVHVSARVAACLIVFAFVYLCLNMLDCVFTCIELEFVGLEVFGVCVCVSVCAYVRVCACVRTCDCVSVHVSLF